jgi:hypothetical protein
VFDQGGMNPDPNIFTNAGILSPFGTAGQGGNVAEWDETAFDRVNDLPNEHRRASGGAWPSTSSVLNAMNTLIGDSPTLEIPFIGLRIASVVPEPSSLLLIAMASLLLVRARLR